MIQRCGKATASHTPISTLTLTRTTTRLVTRPTQMHAGGCPGKTGVDGAEIEPC